MKYNIGVFFCYARGAYTTKRVSVPTVEKILDLASGTLQHVPIFPK